MYTTKTTIDSYLGITLDSSLAVFINLAINSVSRYIENYCGDERFGSRIFEKPETDSDVTKYFDGNGSKSLPVGDLKAITSLTVDNVAQVENEDYFLKPYNAPSEGKPYTHIELVQPDGRQSSRGYTLYEFDKEQRNVKVIGKWRYSDTVPADIQLIATQLVASILKEKIGDQTLREIKAETLDDYKVEYSDISVKAKTLGLTAILDQYKRKSANQNAGIITLD